MINGHGGNLQQVAAKYNLKISEIIDMSSNINPFGPPEGLENFLKTNIDIINCLPEPSAEYICKLVADRYGIPCSRVLAGNGSTQFIYLLPNVLKFKKALIVGPTYSDYADACKLSGTSIDFFLTKSENSFQIIIDELNKIISSYDAVYICNPNNPTGSYIKLEKLKELCVNNPEINFIIDESYLPFCKNHYKETAVHFNLKNVIVLTSMSKIFRIPGLRIGFLVGHNHYTEKISHYIQPWSVNSLSQASVKFIMKDHDRTKNFLNESRAAFKNKKTNFIKKIGPETQIEIFPSETYFHLARLTGNRTSNELFDSLCREKIMIRDCSNFKGLNNKFVRFSLKNGKTNNLLAEALNRILN